MSEPIRNPLPGVKLTPRSSGMPLIFTRRCGAVTSSFIKESRSVPPARTSTSPQRLPSKPETCSCLVGLVYSNGRISASLVESRHDTVGSDGQVRHAHADGVGNRIGDGRRRRNRGRLTQPDGATLVVSLAGHHVDDEFAHITDSGQPVEIHGGI